MKGEAERVKFAASENDLQQEKKVREKLDLKKFQRYLKKAPTSPELVNSGTKDSDENDKVKRLSRTSKLISK